MTKFYHLLGWVIVWSMTACIKDSNPSKPAYIYIENIFFEADSSLGQGSSSSSITDVWASVDGQQLGANNFPATFPVILDENFSTNSVKISAGIKDNGIVNSRAIYPFYEPSVTNIKLEPGKIDTFRPTLHYASNAKVVVVEDFEDPNQAIFTDDLDKNPNTKIVYESDPQKVKEGIYSGLMILDSANLECTVASSTRYYNLNKVASSPVYIELDYQGNTAFQVGLVAHYATGNTEIIYKGGGRASDSWKKFYFNLTQEVYGSNANEYSVIFRAIKPTDLEETPKVYLDNIKLVYF